jgi:hypothetical protein
LANARHVGREPIAPQREVCGRERSLDVGYRNAGTVIDRFVGFYTL